jgi:hypothetical protein
MSKEEPVSTDRNVWDEIDAYFSEIPEGNLALDSRRSADKQLQDIAEAIIAGRPQDIRLDTMTEPNESFKTQQMDRSVDFKRFIEVVRIDNQVEPVLNRTPPYTRRGFKDSVQERTGTSQVPRNQLPSMISPRSSCRKDTRIPENRVEIAMALWITMNDKYTSTTRKVPR